MPITTANLNLLYPCMTRRLLVSAGEALPTEFFPKDQQKVDTPAGKTPTWTTDTRA